MKQLLQAHLKALRAVELLSAIEFNDQALAMSRAKGVLDELLQRQQHIQACQAQLLDEDRAAIGAGRAAGLQLGSMRTIRQHYAATDRALTALYQPVHEAREDYNRAQDALARARHRHEHLMAKRRAAQSAADQAQEHAAASELLSSFLAIQCHAAEANTEKRGVHG